MSASDAKRSFVHRIALLLALAGALSSIQVIAQDAPTAKATLASTKIAADRLKQYSDLAVQWMQDYLRIDTTNPPGNEARAVAFFKKILDQEGIENRVFDYAPGRANLWARIPHTTADTRRPIILLNHMDVVTSDASHWKVPPFSGAILGGSMYGRGAEGRDLPM